MGSPETHHANGGQREGSSPERIPADDRLVPLGPHGNQGKLPPRHPFGQTPGLGEGKAGKAVQTVGVTNHGSVEPAAAAGTPRRGTVLVPPVPDPLPFLVEQLRRKRPPAHPGGGRPPAGARAAR